MRTLSRALSSVCRLLAAATLVVVVSACAAISEPGPELSTSTLDDHCLLHGVAESEATADRLISQARSASDFELRRVAETMASERSRRREPLNRWLAHAETDHQPLRIHCSGSVPMARGARADAALLAALIAQRECALDLVEGEHCEGEKTTSHVLLTAIRNAYRRDLLALRSVEMNIQR